MKIGFDAKRAFLNDSGLGNYSRNTLNALQKYFPGNQYILFTPKINKELFQSYKSFEVISPDSSVSRIFKSLWRTFSLSRLLKKNELDIFHGLSNELPEKIHKSKVPALVTIHDLIFMRFPQFYKPIDRNIYYQKVKYACTSASKIIAISNQTKNDIEYYFKINPEKITVIHQSISPVFFENHQTEPVSSKYNLPEKFILSVGTIEHRKNQLAVLKAVRLAQIDIPVVFVGKPTIYTAELLKFITENKMDDQVEFLTNIPEKDLAIMYRLASLSVYISIFEGFGLPVIESMASSCPVLTSNKSCLPETAGDAAVLCDPANIYEIGERIKTLLNNESFRNEIIQKGVERAKLFHPKIYSEKLNSLYNKIVT